MVLRSLLTEQRAELESYPKSFSIFNAVNHFQHMRNIALIFPEI